MKALVLTLLAFGCLMSIAAWSEVLARSYQHVQKQRADEIACLTDLIATGIERRDIHLEGGRCIVAPNAYYHHP